MKVVHARIPSSGICPDTRQATKEAGCEGCLHVLGGGEQKQSAQKFGLQAAVRLTAFARI